MLQDIEDPLYYCTLLSFSNLDILPNHKSNAITINYKGKEQFEGELTQKLELKFNQDKIEPKMGASQCQRNFILSTGSI